MSERGQRTLLRFITCGSVDDGKSTLIGRLLYESQAVYEDQLAALEDDSKRMGTQGGSLDFALLLDGLTAEREQGITIDVAYRFFSTARRNFIVADTPGHNQYTRNMVTGASTADCAVILVDPTKGVLTQTRRHTLLASVLGIRHAALAVTKMDLVDYAEATFRGVESSYRDDRRRARPRAGRLHPGLGAARRQRRRRGASRCRGTRARRCSSTSKASRSRKDGCAQRRSAFPVQWVNRPDSGFRGFAGTIVGGEVRPGDRICVYPSGLETTVASIATFDGDLEHAVAGQAVTVTLATRST